MLATWNSYRPPIGQSYPIMDSEHLPGEIRPPAYNSNPPTSGPHYDQGLNPGFYDQSDLPDLPYFPEAAAVKNMEEGYIVFWYNCELVDENSCEELKDDIRFLISDSAYAKLVALPWDTTDVPLVLTSWGYLLEMESFKGGDVINFIHSNWRHAPEATAP
ncbi:MAG: DUF3105 domain-containing protein [Chloroflexi bacterium]|nr:DUF3105 domain-containing protein [Chloroflexota bacterium]